MPTTLQEISQRLLRYWEGKGCEVVAPSELAMPVATMHPRVFFRLLEPEPWQAVYLQPLRRPLDGRYGKHPFRLARHFQLQVVLKPPLDVKRLYLQSLSKLGLVPKLHDLRFEEWRWKMKTLAAEGQGWRVLIDGLGVTRVTFLQRLAGRALEPPVVELAYGLERLGMALSGIRNAYEVPWAKGEEGRNARRTEEQELSRHAFEVADAELLRQHLLGFERQAESCLEAGLRLPAYELALECLKVTDALEACGELVGEARQEALGRVRRLVVASAELQGEGAVEGTGG